MKKRARIGLIGGVALTCGVFAGPYEGAVGEADSTAIAATDSRFVSWAAEVVSYTPGLEVDEVWQDATQALGIAEGSSGTIVSLGRGGSLTLGFAQPIRNGEGADFAVFENSFSDFFLELAFVEVSSDGVSFVRFANDSVTSDPVLSFGLVHPTDVTGFAGKYRGGYGTPFDLAELSGAAGLDVNDVRFVRLIDVVGGESLDASGDLIYDPYPTTGSAGFDVDGVGVIHQLAEPIEVLEATVVQGSFLISWNAEVGKSYAVESWTLENNEWQTVEEVLATATEEQVALPLLGAPQRLVRIREM